MNTSKKIDPDEISKVFDEAQNEVSNPQKIDPDRIDKEYMGDEDGTTPEEAEQEIDNEEKREEVTAELSI